MSFQLQKRMVMKLYSKNKLKRNHSRMKENWGMEKEMEQVDTTPRCSKNNSTTKTHSCQRKEYSKDNKQNYQRSYRRTHSKILSKIIFSIDSHWIKIGKIIYSIIDMNHHQISKNIWEIKKYQRVIQIYLGLYKGKWVNAKNIHNFIQPCNFIYPESKLFTYNEIRY